MRSFSFGGSPLGLVGRKSLLGAGVMGADFAAEFCAEVGAYLEFTEDQVGSAVGIVSMAPRVHAGLLGPAPNCCRTRIASARRVGPSKSERPYRPPFRLAFEASALVCASAGMWLGR